MFEEENPALAALEIVPTALYKKKTVGKKFGFERKRGYWGSGEPSDL